jgi:hypothetical protein
MASQTFFLKLSRVLDAATDTHTEESKNTTENGMNVLWGSLMAAIAMEAATLQPPRFSVWPESWPEKIEGKLGFQDIDFDQHPEFSSKFVLRGDDETAVRRFFTTKILDMFAAQPGISVDAIPGLLVTQGDESWRLILASSVQANVVGC